MGIAPKRLNQLIYKRTKRTSKVNSKLIETI